MNNKPQHLEQPRRVWPWLVLLGLVLGIILFAIWVWFAVQNVKRIKASTEQALSALTIQLKHADRPSGEAPLERGR
jgi:hypothetical protein